MKTAPYAWLITVNHLQMLPGERSIVGINGPGNAPLTPEQIKNHPKGQKFRLLDSDREVYCEGILVDLNNTTTGFEPLDDYGAPGMGATTVQYYESGTDGGWKDL